MQTTKATYIIFLETISTIRIPLLNTSIPSNYYTFGSLIITGLLNKTSNTGFQSDLSFKRHATTSSISFCHIRFLNCDFTRTARLYTCLARSGWTFVTSAENRSEMWQVQKQPVVGLTITKVTVYWNFQYINLTDCDKSKGDGNGFTLICYVMEACWWINTSKF